MYVETRGNQRITTRTGAFVTDRAGGLPPDPGGPTDGAGTAAGAAVLAAARSAVVSLAALSTGALAWLARALNLGG